MSYIVSNEMIFYGIPEVTFMGSEIINKFQEDLKLGGNKETSVKRILYGKTEEEEFDNLNNFGCNWVEPYLQSKKSNSCVKFLSGYPAAKGLQDHITSCLHTIDPKVIVQMNYYHSELSIAGTRFSTFLELKGVVGFESQFEPLLPIETISAENRIKEYHKKTANKKMLDSLGIRLKLTS